jgi:carboxyl-terminal processing protease
MRCLVALLALAAGCLAQSPSPQDPSGLADLIRNFVNVYTAVEANAADPVNPALAFESGALPAMLRKLDPHSVFFNRDQYEQLKEMETSTRKGFGSIVSVLPGRVIVLQTMLNSPSARAGLQPGDEIIAINGIALSRFDLEQMQEYLAYTRQRDALLAVRRDNFPRPLEFTLSPAALDAPTVERAFHLKPNYGYIRVASFEDKTGRDLAAAIEKLGGKSLRGLVIDLRNNPGGVFKSALESAALFLPPKTRITSIRGRNKKEENIDVPEDNSPYTFPVALIVNEKSASGSEVLAAALQDNARAKIVGLATYGKGLVQSVFPLSHGSGIALTTAYYYTPKGRSIQRRIEDAQIDPNLNPEKFAGVQPDLRVDPDGVTRLRVFLDANGLITLYAREWTQKNSPPAANWTLPLRELDRFQLWLSEKNVQPSLGEWGRDRDWMLNRLEQEIINLTRGVEFGDEVEARRDPQVQAALATLPQP